MARVWPVLHECGSVLYVVMYCMWLRMYYIWLCITVLYCYCTVCITWFVAADGPVCVRVGGWGGQKAMLLRVTDWTHTRAPPHSTLVVIHLTVPHLV